MFGALQAFKRHDKAQQLCKTQEEEAQEGWSSTRMVKLSSSTPDDAYGSLICDDVAYFRCFHYYLFHHFLCTNNSVVIVLHPLAQLSLRGSARQEEDSFFLTGELFKTVQEKRKVQNVQEKRK